MLAMHYHTHSKSHKSDTDFKISKPPIFFKEWLVYHFVRDKPINAVALSSNEKMRLNQVNLIITKVFASHHYQEP
jgi:hypothetical protein